MHSSALAAQAQPTASAAAFGIERYLNIRSANSPALDPAGERVAFLTNITCDAAGVDGQRSGGWPEQMTFYSDRVDFVSWAPDRSGLIFAKAVGGDENSQLWLDGAEWLADSRSDWRSKSALQLRRLVTRLEED
jgi:hypothetical protein